MTRLQSSGDPGATGPSAIAGFQITHDGIAFPGWRLVRFSVDSREFQIRRGPVSDDTRGSWSSSSYQLYGPRLTPGRRVAINARFEREFKGGESVGTVIKSIPIPTPRTAIGSYDQPLAALKMAGVLVTLERVLGVGCRVADPHLTNVPTLVFTVPQDTVQSRLVIESFTDDRGRSAELPFQLRTPTGRNLVCVRAHRSATHLNAQVALSQTYDFSTEVEVAR